MPERTPELDQLWAEYKARLTLALRNRLIESYLPLVHQIAGRLIQRLPSEVDIDDLFSAGASSLMNSVNNFDPSRGFRFSTLASKRIYGAMLDYLRTIDWMPRNTRERIKQMAAATEQFTTEHGRAPTREELRQKLKLSNAAMTYWEQCVGATSKESLSRKLHNEEGKEWEAQVLADSSSDPAAIADAHLTARDIVATVVREFTVTEALILRLRYFEGETFVGIAAALGALSESRMSQKHAELVAKLRARFNRHSLAALAGRAA